MANDTVIRTADPNYGEERIERWADRNVTGDSFTCACGKQCKLDDGVALTPDPNCIPVCPDCAMADPAYAKWVNS